MESPPTLSAADAWSLLIHTHLPYYVCACVHVHVDVHVMCVRTCVGVQCAMVCMWRFTWSLYLVNLGDRLCLGSRHLYLPSHLAGPFTLPFKTRSLTEPGARWLARLAGQQAPGILLSPCPSAGVTGMCCCMQLVTQVLRMEFGSPCFHSNALSVEFSLRLGSRHLAPSVHYLPPRLSAFILSPPRIQMEEPKPRPLLPCWTGSSAYKHLTHHQTSPMLSPILQPCPLMVPLSCVIRPLRLTSLVSKYVDTSLFSIF